MQGQEFLFKAIEEKTAVGEELEEVKHLSRTSMIEPTDFPAVIIEQEPYDFSQEIGQQGILIRRERYNLAVIVTSANRNELTEAKYKDANDKLDVLTREVIAIILERVSTYDKVSNLAFGRGEIFDGAISSMPVMWNVIPVEITIVN